MPASNPTRPPGGAPDARLVTMLDLAARIRAELDRADALVAEHTGPRRRSCESALLVLRCGLDAFSQAVDDEAAGL